MPCSLLNQSVPSPCATLPQPRRTLQFFALPRQCGSSLYRSGLYRHGAVQIVAVPSWCCATLCPRHTYPRNSMPSQVQTYQSSAVAPADHCVTVRARPFHCRSDHLMTPAFRLTFGHNPCSVIPCKTAHPQSPRISMPRSHLASPSRPLPRLRSAFLHSAMHLPSESTPIRSLPPLISSAPCCAAADLCQSRTSPMRLVPELPSPMPSHRPASRRCRCPHLSTPLLGSIATAILIRVILGLAPAQLGSPVSLRS